MLHVATLSIPHDMLYTCQIDVKIKLECAVLGYNKNIV